MMLDLLLSTVTQIGDDGMSVQNARLAEIVAKMMSILESTC